MLCYGISENSFEYTYWKLNTYLSKVFIGIIDDCLFENMCVIGLLLDY